MKWIVRGAIVLVGAALALILIAIAYLWYIGAELIGRGREAGWVITANDAPMTSLEEMVAKVEFGDTWNRTSFPCHAVTGAFGRRNSGHVSQLVARDMKMKVDGTRTLTGRFAEMSAACQFETMHDDLTLLRAWLAKSVANLASFDTAAAEVLRKPASDLSESERALTVAILRTPNLMNGSSTWDERAKQVLAEAQSYKWVGNVLEATGTP